MSEKLYQTMRENRKDNIVPVEGGKFAVDGKIGRYDSREAAVKVARAMSKPKLR